MAAVALSYRDALVQSPTATQMYLACPLRYQQYLSGATQEVSPAMQTGRLMHQYLHHYLATTDAARLNAAWEQLLAHHGRLAHRIVHIPYAVTTALQAATTHVELRLGAARLDHVLQRQNGTYVIIDYKYVPHSIHTSNVSQLLHHNHQLLHYAWAFSQYSDIWFSQEDFTIDYGVCLISDDTCFIETVTATKNRLQKWLENSVEIWYTMQRIRNNYNTAYRNEHSCYETVYGHERQCTYYRHCHGDIRQKVPEP